MTQQNLDQQNAAFWNELCGTGLARSLGITAHTPESLRRFDEAYAAIYPYLSRYIIADRGKKALEIGLGYGTLGQMLASCGLEYYGLDIAPGPVSMMRARLEMLCLEAQNRVFEGSALALPFADASFDYIYSIGCLHHTGHLPRAVDEVHRVLKPGGRAVIMLYNRNSFRLRIQVPLRALKARIRGGRRSRDAQVRAMYDANAAGEAAPHTDFVSKREARKLFSRFSKLTIDVQNFDACSLFKGKLYLRREWFLKNLARVAGLDLYIRAVK